MALMQLVWRDPVTWIPLLEISRGRRQSAEKVIHTLRSHYEGIVVYHGARPSRVEAYYENGLQLSDHVKLTQRARAIFLTADFPELDIATFQIAAERVSDIDNNRLFVGLDDRMLLTRCGHYLIYGSEHICGIAASLSRNRIRDYRQVLKQFGKPTILKLLLRLSFATESDLGELGELLLRNLSNIRSGKSPPTVDFTFSVQSEIPSECIIGHEHPIEIPDPLLGGIIYRYTPYKIEGLSVQSQRMQRVKAP